MSRRIRIGRRAARGTGRTLATALAAAACFVSAVALAGCGGAMQRDAATHVIAGGGTTGIYYAYGGALAEALRDDGLNIRVAETAGSVDNLLRVGHGEALLGFAQADTAADALAGQGAFDEPLEISAIARVYDEYVHVVVPADSEVEEIEELAGKRVSIGDVNSGVTVVADRVLSAAGVEPGDFEEFHLGIDGSVAALARGEIDAFLWVGGVPTPGIDSLSGALSLRMVPVRPELIERVNEGHEGVYRVSDFPVGSYGIEGTVETMTIPNLLVTQAGAAAPLVEDVTRSLFASRAALSGQAPAIALLDRRQAIFTDPLPLHPGAADYYVNSWR